MTLDQITVVLIHGYPFNRDMWAPQIEFLNSNGRRAIAPDLPGFGSTRAFSEVTTMPDMARAIAELLTESSIDRAVICGLSMGGYVALEFVQLFRERVLALVLAGTRAPADNEQERQARTQQAELMLTQGMKPVAESSLPKLLSKQTQISKPDVVAHVRQMILDTDPQGAAAAQRGMAARRDYSADLSGIDVPTLIVVGREDTIRPVSDAEFMHQRIPNSRLEIIEDAAHLTNMEQPATFNQALLEFLKLI